MKRLLFILLWLGCIHSAFAQTAYQTDTVNMLFSKVGTISKDTAFCDYSGVRRDLERFFYKNIQAPFIHDSAILGASNLYFIIDKAGCITQAWYDQSMNNEIGASALQSLKHYPRLRATFIGKEPAVTKLTIRVNIVSNETYKEGDNGADIIVISYGIQRKQDITGF